MQKKFITNLAFLLFLNLLIKPFWLLGIDRTVQNVVGAEAYGFYYALFNFSFLFNILLDLGITNFNNRNISQNRQLLDKHLSGIILLRLVLAAVYFLVSLITAFAIGYKIEHLSFLLILLVNQMLISFILYLRSNLAGLHLFRTDSIISVLDRAIMIGLCAFLLWGTSGFRIEWFIWAQTVAYIATVIITLFILSGKVRFIRLNWNPVFFTMILKKSYPYAILILLMTFYNRIDSVMLERMLADGTRQAGIYAQAYRLLDASNMIAFLFAGLLLPIFAHMLKKKEEISDLLQLGYSLLAVPALILGVVSILYRNEIMDLLYVDHVKDSSVVFALLMTCFFAISTTYIFGTLLTANGNLKQLNTMAFIGMAINFGLNLFLIPYYQATGAAISSLITQFTTALIQVMICYKIFKLHLNPGRILRFLFFAIVSFLICYTLKNWDIDWRISLMLASFLCLGVAFIFKLIDPVTIYHTLRSKGAETEA